MADNKITQLPTGTTIFGNDLFAVAHGITGSPAPETQQMQFNLVRDTLKSYNDTLYQPSGSIIGGYSSFGLNGITTGSSTQMQFSCDYLVLRNPTNGHTAFVNSTGTINNNVATAGPAANGRDQSGAFTASTWVHFYYIWNGATLATLSSASAPPTNPTLPSGYTHWCYIGAIRFNASSVLQASYIRGNYVAHASGLTPRVLSAGTATVQTAVDIAATVPPNALAFIYVMTYQNTGSAGTNMNTHARSGDTGANTVYAPVTSVFASMQCSLPNVSQNIYYQNSSANGQAYIDIAGYTVPNGGC